VNAVEIRLIEQVGVSVVADGAERLVDAILEAACHIDGNLLSGA
jgi:hypothetical protein